MKKLVLTILVFIFTARFTFSQKAFENSEIIIGNALKPIKSYWTDTYYDSNKIMELHYLRSHLTIVCYNATNYNLISNELSTKFAKKTKFITSKKIKGKYYLFYSRWNRKMVKDQLFCRQIDFSNGKLFDKEILLLSSSGYLVPNSLTDKFYTRIENEVSLWDKFEIHFSYDSSKILFTYTIKPKILSDAKSYAINGMFIFDNDLKLLWGDEIEMFHTEKKMYNTKFAVDKNGNAYILSTIIKTDDRKLKISKEDIPNYYVEAICIPSNTKKFTKENLSIATYFPKTRYLYNLSINEGPDDYMICNGIYNYNQLDKLLPCSNISNGVAHLRILKNSNKIDANFVEFKPDLLGKDKWERKGKTKGEKSWIHGIQLYPIQFDRNGESILIAEQQTFTTIGIGENSYNIDNYKEIFIYKFSKEGELIWYNLIPKDLNSFKRFGFKYLYNKQTGTHYIMFNDHVKNLYIKPNQKPVYCHGFEDVLNAYIIEEDGEIYENPIFQAKFSKDSKLQNFHSHKIFHYSNNSFIMMCSDGLYRKVFVRVKLKE